MKLILFLKILKHMTLIHWRLSLGACVIDTTDNSHIVSLCPFVPMVLVKNKNKYISNN